MGRMTYNEFYKERLDRLLMPLLGDEELVKRWWVTPNLAFNGEHPEKTFDSNPPKVIEYILKQFHH